jgi:1-acyl-sn-glycerol-3-phosphate acyltransferase
MRTVLAFLALGFGTAWHGGMVLLAQLFGVRQGPGSVYDRAPVRWGRLLLRAAGVTVVRHGQDDLPANAPRVYIANHVSWFDIPAALDALPHYGFVAKRELESIPLFGSAARAAGVIYIDRENRKAAFSAYDDAAEKIRNGRSVLVYAEGTRGDGYALRPFKKGPFVLAIGSGAPIVPVLIYGTIAVNPRGSFRASPGTVHVHTLEPIPTEGLTYADRDALAERVRQRMADVLRTTYGIDPALEVRAAKRVSVNTPEYSPS